ncbi:type II toxin-antitoxin system RelE/ParE family toxin [Photorhabdus noenieputensis]|uniref:type II toxin-antitoxin system RelE/ParE family toxin n=1 Tax=Photorhabdus noenieputensis TaxID=1208607 RepID=UPI0035E3D86F
MKGYEKGTTAGIVAHHANRLDLLLNALDLASCLNDLSLPSFQLHPLTGDRKGIWAVNVSDNWRLTFEFNDGDVYTLWISRCIATARERIPGSIANYVTGVSECSQQRGNLKDNGYIY